MQPSNRYNSRRYSVGLKRRARSSRGHSLLHHRSHTFQAIFIEIFSPEPTRRRLCHRIFPLAHESVCVCVFASYVSRGCAVCARASLTQCDAAGLGYSAGSIPAVGRRPPPQIHLLLPILPQLKLYLYPASRQLPRPTNPFRSSPRFDHGRQGRPRPAPRPFRQLPVASSHYLGYEFSHRARSISSSVTTFFFHLALFFFFFFLLFFRDMLRFPSAAVSPRAWRFLLSQRADRFSHCLENSVIEVGIM